MSIIINNAYIDLTGAFISAPSTIDKVSGGSNLTSQIGVVSPQPADFNTQITITNEFGKNVGWLSAIYDTTVEYDGDTWNRWYYNVQQSVLAQVSRLNASKLYFQFRWREQDSNYLGALTTTETFDASGYETAISDEIIAEYGTGTDGQWILVTDSNLDTRSFESNGTIWEDLGYALAIYPNIYTQNTPIEIPVTGTIVASESELTNSELVIITAWLTALGADVSDLQDDIVLKMYTSEFATEGTATKDVKWARNMRSSSGVNESTASEVAITVARVDQDVKTTASPLFVGVTADTVTVGSRSITENNTDSTLDVTLSPDVTGQMFQEELTFVKNNSGVNISNGDLVYISGSSGIIAEITLATNTVKAKAHSTIGMATEAISDGSTGFVTRSGLVRGIETVSYLAGDILYLGIDGAFTKIKPTPPTYLVEVGIVVKVGGLGVGSILVNVDKVHEIAEAPDVSNDSPSDGDILIYDGDSKYYKALAYNDRVLNDISDVNVPSPMLGEVLQYNGVEWVNGDIVTQGAGKSITWFVEDTASGVTGYELLSETPLGLIEEDDSVVLSSALTDTLIDPYATLVLGRTKIEAGSWNFETYARVSSTNGATKIKFKVYKRTTAGTETLLFEAETEEINATVNQLYSIISVQPEFTILATDRIVVKYYGYTTSVANPTVTLVHSGTDNASHIDTPLQTLHNDLAGLQGGSSSERYHLSEAELTKLTDEVVEKDLSNDTTYPPVAASAIVDEDLATMYLDDNGTPKKMTLTEVYAGANTATGSFVASGDYSPDGLRANDTAFTVRHTMLLNGTYQVYVDVKDIALGQMAMITLPTMTVDTPLEISFDNQTTYRELLVNSEGVPAVSMSGQRVIVERTADGLIYTATAPLESTQSNSAVISSTKDIIAPIDGGAPRVDVIYGKSTLQLVDGADIANLGTVTFASVVGVNYWDSLNNIILAGTGSDIIATNNSGATADMMIIVQNGSLIGKSATEMSAQFPTYLDNGYTDLVNPELKFYGKNLLNKDSADETDGYYDLTGTFVSNVLYDVYYAPVVAGESYTRQGTTGTNVTYWNGTSFISGSTLATSVAPSGATRLKIAIEKTDLSADDQMVEQGTTATTYTPYASPSDNFKLYGTAREVGDVRDTFEYVVDHYELVQRVALHTLQESDIDSVGSGANVDYYRIGLDVFSGLGTITSTSEYTKFNVVGFNGSSIDLATIASGNWFSVNSTTFYLSVPSGTYADLAAAKTALAGTVIRYVLDSASYVTTAVDQDGSTYQEEVTTIEQVGSFGTDYDVVFALNKDKQDELDTLNIQSNKKEISANEVNIATNATDIDTAEGRLDDIETKTDFITVTQAVDLDTMESNISTNAGAITDIETKTDFITITQSVNLDTMESNISTQGSAITDIETKTDFITVTQAVNLDTIESDLSGVKTKTDFITVTENVDLDKVPERVLLNSTKLDVPFTTTEPVTANITLSESMDNFDALEIHTKYTTVSTKIEQIILPTNNDETSLSGNAGFSNVSVVDYYYNIKRISSTTLTAWYASSITTTFSTNATAYATVPGIDLVKIYGIKY